MIIQLETAMPVITPKGKALAHFIINEGSEHNLKWVCFLEKNGECWTFANSDIRAQKNITEGREYISPFNSPEDVGFNKEDLDGDLSKIDYKYLYEQCYENSMENIAECQYLKDKINEWQELCCLINNYIYHPDNRADNIKLIEKLFQECKEFKLDDMKICETKSEEKIDSPQKKIYLKVMEECPKCQFRRDCNDYI